MLPDPRDADPLTVEDVVYDPEVGAWVPRPSMLWACLAGIAYGLAGIALGFVLGVLLTSAVNAASRSAAEVPVLPLPSVAPVISAPRPSAGEPIPPPAATVIRGTATWFCGSRSACTRGYGPSDLVAAIDPTLGIPKGTRLTVTTGHRSVVVRVVDICACRGPRIIDLTSGAFRRLAPLSRGTVAVTISLGGVLPGTDAP